MSAYKNLTQGLSKELLLHLSDLDLVEMEFSWKQADWLKLLESSANYFLSWIEADHLPQAFALYHVLGDQAHLLKIATRREKTKQGLATILFENDLNYLISKDIRSLYLEVDVENVPAVKFYEKHSFKVLQIKPKFYSNGHDAYAMLKKL